MITIIASAKTFHPVTSVVKGTTPIFEEETKQLVSLLQNQTPSQLAECMKMSHALGEVNYERYQYFYNQRENSALASFYGAMYQHIEVEQFTNEDFAFAQSALVLLSGLYGYLRPLDLIREYRLEMATPLLVEDKKLYGFWQEKITNQLLQQLEQTSGDKVLLNVASKEYSKVISLRTIKQHFPVIEVSFKEQKGEKFQTVGTYAKMARGRFVQYLVKQRITTIEKAKQFTWSGYEFNPTLSSEKEIIFTR